MTLRCKLVQNGLKRLQHSLSMILATSISCSVIIPYAQASTFSSPTSSVNHNSTLSAPVAGSVAATAGAVIPGAHPGITDTPTQTTHPTIQSTMNPATTTTSVNTTNTRTTTPSIMTSSNAQMPKNAPLDQPNMSDDSLLNYAAEVAKSVYSYDFKNYNKQLQTNQQYFTPEGWKAFTAALDKSNNLNVVQNKKLVASANAVGSPSILKKGIKNGLYTWEAQIPIQATYENESRILKQNLLVTLLISRANNSSGVGVSHFVAVIVPSPQPTLVQPQSMANQSTPTTISTPGATTTTAPSNALAPTGTGTSVAPNSAGVAGVPGANAVNPSQGAPAAPSNPSASQTGTFPVTTSPLLPPAARTADTNSGATTAPPTSGFTTPPSSTTNPGIYGPNTGTPASR